MAKKIKFDYNGKKYILEFNREAINVMERQGFNTDEIDAKPQTMITMLFTGSFYMHHRNVCTNRKLVHEMYEKFKNKEQLLEALINMYQEPLLCMFDDPEENEGNIDWGQEE